MNELRANIKGWTVTNAGKPSSKRSKSKAISTKIEKIVHSVGHSERSDAVVEPMLSKQWFVKMKPLAEKFWRIKKAEAKSSFSRNASSKVLTRWMKRSRRLVRLPPALVGPPDSGLLQQKDRRSLGFREEPDLNLYRQDEDVLDTWFSSGLWPFSDDGLARYRLPRLSSVISRLRSS
jgi:valyl-tRNA synthetase